MTKKLNGFTLVEMIIAIVLTAIIVTGASRLLVQGFRAYYLGKDTVNTDWQARIAMERMTRDLRAIRSSNDIISATSNSISFNDTSGNNISYQLSGTQLTRILNSGTTNVLADNMAALNFSYYDINGALLTVPLGAAARLLVRYIIPTIQVTYTGSYLADYTVTAGVYPWNLY